MNSLKIFGITIFIIGIILLIFGINATSHFQDEVSQRLTGRYTDETMWYLIGGIAMILGGLFSFFSKKRG